MCHSVEIDFARTSYHSPCKVAWTHFFPLPFHFGGNYFCWRAVCDVYLPTGGWNDSESEFEPGQSLRENQPPLLSLSLILILPLFLARFQRNCFLVLAFPRLIQLLDSLFSLLYRCFPSITIVHDNSCKAACEILNVLHCCSCKL